MKYILVTGGVISGIGKGVIASSIGALLKSCGFRVTCIKIDPYINIDAGTFSPYEHGEVYVLDDGAEVDLDLGNYERFLDISLTRMNNLTTGKVYQQVIEKERRGDYLGRTVQVVPHVVDHIQELVEQISQIPVDGGEDKPEICIIELGGTVGDIESMPFVEAFRQFQFRKEILGQNAFCSVHVSLIPEPKATGEQKTKPTQNSVKELRGLGITPDLIVCRSSRPISVEIKSKISMFCHVPVSQVIGMEDARSIYQVPLMLKEQGCIEFFSRKMKLSAPTSSFATGQEYLKSLRILAKKIDLPNIVKIALVGKYTKLEDAYASVVKALQHAALHLDLQLELIFIEAENLEEKQRIDGAVKYHDAWRALCESDGLIVPGGFGDRGVQGKIAAIEWARTKPKPFLGVCLGLQAAVIEFCRNKIGWKEADSSEFSTCKDDNNSSSSCHHVIIDMPEHTTGNKGGTMRLGKRVSKFEKKDSVIYSLYGEKDTIEERHRHRYEINPSIVETLEKNGLRIIAKDDTGKRMEIIDIKDHPYFVGVQFHPEYLSRPLSPSPPYLGLIRAAFKNKPQARNAFSSPNESAESLE